MCNESLEKLKQYIIDEEMPYLSAMEGFWKQHDDKILRIAKMESNHLLNSIRVIERDIEYLEGSPAEIKSKLIDLAEKKKMELKVEYESKIY